MCFMAAGSKNSVSIFFRLIVKTLLQPASFLPQFKARNSELVESKDQ